MSKRQLHLNVNANALGRAPGGWRLRDDPLGFIDIAEWENLGRTAERGLLDAVFLAETYGFGQQEFTKPWNAIDPFIVLTAIARATTHVGLVATVSSTYRHPYHIARLASSLDLVSDGRAAINVVTTQSLRAGAQFGRDAHPDRDTRYGIADESISVIKELWQSWEPDALVGDAATGELTDVSKVREVDYAGEHVRVNTYFQVPRSPQGHPVVLQAGASDQGIDLAAKHADAVFCAEHSLAQGKDFANKVKSRARDVYGRDPDDVLILPGLWPVMGSTEAEARERRDLLASLSTDSGDALGSLAKQLGLPLASLDLDKQPPWDLINAPEWTPTSFGFANSVLHTARVENLTVRDMVDRHIAGGGHRMVVGTPEQVADEIEAFFTEGAADGFNLNHDFYPDGLDLIVDHLVPELQRRGIFRKEYESTTLRGHLGLPVPTLSPADA
ncbi:NtaA/DmoA family FMN-dependent monooxygenase [Mycobacterium sp. 236(2023)]|uniref:NtaA/DmoA family FMN-dependent monooxygenase n=1 Tax=Mycobacterium sp. 236(2023) TaxID=3038163 RepID=UPI0024152C13|nr:NtaA/DmoA family FMN-dependent monooxygenase [Mycobacterium sp. 236(2023)]MDG4667650.1 NtaA/DmoA family FMN-dependent monooxygenase [Mycobacterium sp. 236(2023)]